MKGHLIGLDGRALSNVSRYRGIGRYTACMIENIVRLGGDGFRFLALGYGESPEESLLDSEILSYLEWWPLRRLPGPYHLTFPGEYASVAMAARKAKVDLFHAMDHNLSPFLRCPSIVTVHDLIPLVLRGPYLGPFSWTWLQAHRMAASRASAVIAVSENTARDIRRFWKIPPDRIRVIPEGVEDFYRPVEDGERIDRVLSKYGITRPYLLYAGGFDPRKNVRNLLRVFRIFSRRHPEYRLVLCGDTTAFEGDLRSGIQAEGLQESVVLTGFVEREELPALYSGAACSLYLSLYEGFGLPVLESMACGCPVVASRAASLPEVLGEAGVLVSPQDPEEAAAAVERICSDREFRASLAEKGLRRAAQFSWSKAAGEALDLYRQILGGRRP